MAIIKRYCSCCFAFAGKRVTGVGSTAVVFRTALRQFCEVTEEEKKRIIADSKDKIEAGWGQLVDEWWHIGRQQQRDGRWLNGAVYPLATIIVAGNFPTISGWQLGVGF